MSSPGDTAVLVLAAGPGTRMRSDTPKVLHTLGGRSMLSHLLHAIAKVAPQHLAVVLGHDHERIAPLIADWADDLGRPIDVALQERPRGTGDAVRCIRRRCPTTTPASWSSPPATPRCWTPTPWPT